MSTAVKFGGVPYDAPLFRRATPSSLEYIVEELSLASFHFADDSGRGWASAHQHLRNAARRVVMLKLPFRAIECLHKHRLQLATFEHFMDTILKEVYPS